MILSKFLVIVLLWALPLYLTAKLFKLRFKKVLFIIIVYSIIQAVIGALAVGIFSISIGNFSDAASIMGMIT